MSKLDLRVRNLETGEVLHAAFDNVVDATRWLVDRPRWVEVLGVATHGLPQDVYASLRVAARPLDDDEAAVVRRLDAADEAAWRAAEEASRRQDAEDLAAYREAQRAADPNRPMALAWSRDGGLHVVDPYDPREVTAAARDAVLAWVRERDEWVRDRGLVVGEATLTVWPGEVPAGADRVHPGGQFIPTSPPAKG